MIDKMSLQNTSVLAQAALNLLNRVEDADTASEVLSALDAYDFDVSAVSAATPV